MNKKVLITGGTGYIGSHISLKLFELGFDVYIIDSFINSSHLNIENLKLINTQKKKNFNNKIYIIQGDIRDKSFLEKLFIGIEKKNERFYSVIHLAGLKSVTESSFNPLSYWDVNVNGTINLLEVMSKFDCKTIIFSSSATIYGKSKKNFLSEDLPINPCNPYGETKATIEKILSNLFFSDFGNWRICNLRYFNPAGADPSGLIGEKFCLNPNNLFPYLNLVAGGKKKFLKIYGKDWPTRDGTAIRDYVHVNDLAFGHILAMNYLSAEKSQILNLNLGTGNGNTVLEVLNTFQKVNNCEIKYVFNDRRIGDVTSLVANNRNLKKLFKWSPSISISDMCRHSWNWFLKNKSTL